MNDESAVGGNSAGALDVELRAEAAEGHSSAAMPQARAGGVVATIVFWLQGPCLLLLPWAVIFLPGGADRGGFTMLISGVVFAPAMFFGQLITLIATAIHARRSGIMALGRPTLCCFAAYCGCVLLYTLSATETDDVDTYPSLLMRMGVSSGTSASLVDLAMLGGAVMLLVTLMVSLADGPRALRARRGHTGRSGIGAADLKDADLKDAGPGEASDMENR